MPGRPMHRCHFTIDAIDTDAGCLSLGIVILMLGYYNFDNHIPDTWETGILDTDVTSTLDA
jgi:hypothetical protein